LGSLVHMQRTCGPTLTGLDLKDSGFDYGDRCEVFPK